MEPDAQYLGLLSLLPGGFRERAPTEAYFAFWSAGVLIWLIGTGWLAGREGLSRWRVVFTSSLLVPMAILGARLHHVLIELGWPLLSLWEYPAAFFRPGFRLPGGILLALLTLPLAARLLRLPFRLLADCVVPFVGMALAVGRMGCLSRGCCHGEVCDLPWAIIYPAGTSAHTNHVLLGWIERGATASLPVHPFPIYFAVAGLLGTVLLLWLRPRRLYAGEVALAGIAIFSASAALITGLREEQGFTPVPLRQLIPALNAMWAGALLLIFRLRVTRPARLIADGRCP